MSQIELACKEAVFHFNKKHLEDSTVPMWIVMAKGETYYVEHVDANIPWTTKETPDNVRTKGALKFKECLLTIGEDNCATIGVLTAHDQIRLRNQERGITRIQINWEVGNAFANIAKNKGIRHGPIKRIPGRCGSTFYITDILSPRDMTILGLVLTGKYREIMPNEALYKYYDDPESIPDEEDDLEEMYEE